MVRVILLLFEGKLDSPFDMCDTAIHYKLILQFVLLIVLNRRSRNNLGPRINWLTRLQHQFAEDLKEININGLIGLGILVKTKLID